MGIIRKSSSPYASPAVKILSETFLHFYTAIYGYLAEYLQLHQCRPQIEKTYIIIDGHVCIAVFIYLIFFIAADWMLIYIYLSL